MKFGGSCLDTPDDVRRMVRLIKSEEKHEPKIVLSAFKGITDQLVAQANSARYGKFDTEPIERKHRQILDNLPASIRTSIEARVTELLEDLHHTLTAVSYLKELTPSTMDKIVTFGERLAIHLVSGYMTEANLKSKALSGIEAGILTNSNFGNATILEKSCELVRERVGSTHVALIAGYFGHDEAGRIATLGRGASDYIASYVASALGCECVLYKDVDGIMTADPKMVKNAKLVTEIDYPSAIEIARYGSKVIFEKAVYPAMKKNLTIRVTNFLTPGEGTLISGEGKARMISCLKNVVMINISDLPGLDSIASVLRDFAAANTDDLFVTTRVLRNEISLITVKRCVDTISGLVKCVGDAVNAEVRTGLGLVAVVAAKLGIPEVYESLQREKIESHATVEGSSGRSVLITVDMNDLERAAKVLHDRLVSGRGG
jgi:aspartate kinase